MRAILSAIAEGMLCATPCVIISNNSDALAFEIARSHGGQGMHGSRVHEAVIEAGDRISGASVHQVEAEYDTGPVVSQRSVTVEIGDTPTELESRITAIEPDLFVETLRAISSGRIDLDQGPTGLS
jgi:folate-dependent phosphoribosylglycinamide formyltransferase PurN